MKSAFAGAGEFATARAMANAKGKINLACLSGAIAVPSPDQRIIRRIRAGAVGRSPSLCWSGAFAGEDYGCCSAGSQGGSYG